MTHSPHGARRSNTSSPANEPPPKPSRRGSKTELVAHSALHTEEKKQANKGPAKSYAYPNGKISGAGRVVKVIKGGTKAAPADEDPYVLAVKRAEQRRKILQEQERSKIQNSQAEEALRSPPCPQTSSPKQEAKKAPLQTPLPLSQRSVSPRREKTATPQQPANKPPSHLHIVSPRGEQREGDLGMMPGGENFVLSVSDEPPSDTYIFSAAEGSYPMGEQTETSTLTPGAESPSPRDVQTEGAENEESTMPEKEASRLPLSQQSTPRRDEIAVKPTTPRSAIRLPPPSLDKEQTSGQTTPRRVSFQEQQPPSREDRSPNIATKPSAPRTNLLELIKKQKASFNAALADVERERDSVLPLLNQINGLGVEQMSKEFQSRLLDEARGVNQEERGAQVLAMMQEAIEEAAKTQKRFIGEKPRMEELQIEDEKTQEFESRPKIHNHTIDATLLNCLFPLINPPKEKRFSKVKGYEEFEVEPLNPTPMQIAGLQISEEEIDGVRSLSFLRSNITDEQLAALVKKFPKIERIHLSLCEDLTQQAVPIVGHIQAARSIIFCKCPGIPNEAVAELPFSELHDLQELGLSTDEEIPDRLFEQLEKAPNLTKVNFNFSPKLTANNLKRLKPSKRQVRLEVSARNCKELDVIAEESPEQLEELDRVLNEGREDHPINIEYGHAQSADYLAAGIPYSTEVPPKLEEGPTLLSNQSMIQLIPEDLRRFKNLEALPELQYIKESPELDIEGIEFAKPLVLSVDPKNDNVNTRLIALFGKCPKAEVISLFNIPDLDQSVFESIRKFAGIKKLYLGCLQKIVPKHFEKLFSNDHMWALRDIHVAGLPIPDEAFKFFSTLENLERLNISGCVGEFTVQGLNYLFTGKVKTVIAHHCPSIDPIAWTELETFRMEMGTPITIDAERMIDPSVLALAEEETNKAMFDPLFKQRYYLLEDYLNAKEPIYFGDKINFEPPKAIEYYRETFNKLGAEIEIDPNQPIEQELLRLDLLYQSIIGTRVLWALLKEWKRVGFFTNSLSDPAQAPETVEKILRLLSLSDHKGQYLYVKKVKILDWECLGIQFPPYYITQVQEWSQLTHIKLNKTGITTLPDKFIDKCPMLQIIQYPNQTLEARQGFADDCFFVTKGIEAIPNPEKIEKFSFINCDHFTLQGWHYLLENFPALTSVKIENCRSFDIHAIEKILATSRIKPNINIQSLDLTIDKLAEEEAYERMNDKHVEKKLTLFKDHGGDESDIQGAIDFYQGKFPKIKNSDDNLLHELQQADQQIQAHINIFRTAKALEKGLFVNKALVNVDHELRETVAGMIKLLTMESPRGDLYADMITSLNFSHLELTYLPKYIREIRWNEVLTIDLRGTKVSQLPEGFKEHCPKLMTIFYPDRKEILRLPPSVTLDSKTIQELIDLKNPKQAINLLKLNNYSDQITTLDLSHLDQVPEFILKTTWNHVTKIDCRGSKFGKIPKDLEKRCPELKPEHILYSEEPAEIPAPPSAPEEKKEESKQTKPEKVGFFSAFSKWRKKKPE